MGLKCYAKRLEICYTKLLKQNIKERREYGDTLLNAIKTGGNYKNSVAAVTLWENKKY